jgi:hypothetical protein
MVGGRGERRTAWGLRVVLGAVVVVSALAHLQVWSQGMRNVAVIGPLFLLQAVAGLVLGVLLVVWRHWLPLLAAIGFGAATLLAFVIATSPVGLFGVHSRWTGAPEWVSAITEAAAVVLGLLALRVERRGRSAVSGA